MHHHRRISIIGCSVLSVSLIGATACRRDAAPATTAREATPASAAEPAAGQRQQHQADVARLQERVSEIERKYNDANREVRSGARTPTAGLREELKEDVGNVKEAVSNLSTTTPENWWDRNEQAMMRTADDIDADVRRISGTNTPAAARPAGTTGVAENTAPFTSRRDAFVASLEARVDAMKKRLDDVKASGARKTELTDTRARLDKLDEDIDKLKKASADDWWDVSKARVSEYVERVEDSVGRLDNDKPAR